MRACGRKKICMRFIRNLFAPWCVCTFDKMSDLFENFDKLNYHIKITLMLINATKISK
jgi:hypothetical protein